MPETETQTKPFAHMDVSYTLNEEYISRLSPETQDYIRKLIPDKKLLNDDPAGFRRTLSEDLTRFTKLIKHQMVSHNEEEPETKNGDHSVFIRNIISDYAIKAHYGNLEVMLSSDEDDYRSNLFVVGTKENPSANTLFAEPKFDKDLNAFRLKISGGKLCYAETMSLVPEKILANVEKEIEEHFLVYDPKMLHEVLNDEYENIMHRAENGGSIDLTKIPEIPQSLACGWIGENHY